MRIAVIGGGTAGLAAAYELEQARLSGIAVEYTLFEARARLGGALSSEVVNGAVLESGPDSFLTEKSAAAELCRELGLGGELTPSNDAARKTYIVVHNRPVSLPDGLMFMVPTKLIPTAFSPLFSFQTKLRMARELMFPPRAGSEADETVAALVERHFGAEMVDRLADPLLSGIYGGDSAQLSACTVLPRLVQMERQYGSLTRGMLAAHSQMQTRAKSASSSQPAPRAIFTTLRGGMQQIVDAIESRLNPAWVRLSTPVSEVRKTARGWSVCAGGLVEEYNAIIISTPAWAADKLLAGLDATLAEELRGIPYSSSVTVNLLYDESKLGSLPAGFGFLVPVSEGRALLACTFVHRKFLGRTPPGKAVLRAFLGGMKNGSLLEASDDLLASTVRRELGEILGKSFLGATVEPEHIQITRWPRTMAQYAVGHQERKQRIASRVAVLAGLRLAGNAYDGIGVPDCFRLGRQAARELVAEGALSS
jgi:protoporphyrinogen/coproporphyrinogen III oxidase